MHCPDCGKDTTATHGVCTTCNAGAPTRLHTDVAAAVLTPFPAGLTAGAEGATQLSGAALGPAAGGQLTIGQNFGARYHIIKQLGVGGMGAVYQAWDSELGVAVALKVVRPDALADPDDAQQAERRFKQELLLAREVTHRNVVRIHDLGEINGIKFISMPYIQGSDLDGVLRKTGKLPVERTLVIARQVAAGLAAAHEAGVIHRDLKPGNIMLDAEDRAYIMDFGISRPAAAGTATATRSVMGTIEYMAPEQALGHRPDARTDMYAFGLILYDTLAGMQRLHGTDTGVAELMGRMNQAPPPLRSLVPEVPEALEQVVMRCLQPDPAARYQSTIELVTALDSLGPDGHPKAGPTVVAAPGVLAQLALLGPRTRRARLLAAGAALLLVVAAAGAIVLQWRSGPTAPTARSHNVSIAILPFRNASGDASLDWIGGSFAELLRSEFGQSASVHAISSDRVHRILTDLRIAPDATLDPQALRRLAEFSNAQTILWGQYVRFGNEVHFSATLDDVARQRATPLSLRAAGDAGLLTAASELAQTIRERLALPPDVIKELQASAFKPSTRSLQALRHYNEGVALARSGRHSEALAKFEASLQEDSAFALARSKVAQAYAAVGRTADAEEASRAAVRLAEALPQRERYVIEAAHAGLIGDNKRALEAYENLVKVAPDDLDIRFALAGLYEATGAYDRAHEHLAKVLERDPKYIEALVQMGRVESRRRNWQGALDRLNPALSLAIQLGDDEAKANVLHTIGVVYKRLNKPEDALKHYQEALAIRQRFGRKGSIATTLNEIGQVQGRLGRPDDALNSYLQALELRRELGDKRGLGSTLIDLGVLHLRRGNYDEALRLYKESLHIQREIGNRDFEALCLNNIGHAYLLKGQYDDARTYFERALELRERSSVPTELALTLHNLAETASKLGQYDEALKHYLRALELLRKAGENRNAAMEQHYMATVFSYQGRYGAALKAEEEALNVLRAARDRTSWLAGVLSGQGLALAQTGRFDEARPSLDEALALSRELKDQALVAQSLNYQGLTAFYRGDLAAARLLFQQALAAAQPTKDPHLVLLARVNQAKIAVREGRGSNAIMALRGLADEADKAGLRHLSIEASIYLGEGLLQARRYAAAQEELARALARSERLGLLPLRAQAHALLARMARATSNAAQVTRHEREASRLLEALGREAEGGDLAKRADFRAIFPGGAP